VYTVDLSARLPAVLEPETWARYTLSTPDIQRTFAVVDSSLTWQTHLILSGQLDPCLPVGGVTCSILTSAFDLTFTRKPALVRTIIKNHAVHTPSAILPSAICHENKIHCPHLPRIVVDQDSFALCAERVPDREPTFRWCVVYDACLQWKDVQYVPVYRQYELDLVCLYRIIPEHTYTSMRVHPKRTYATLPTTVVVAGSRYVLTEEACLVASCGETHQMIQRLTLVGCGGPPSSGAADPPSSGAADPPLVGCD
jgi:hypothetical protein